MYNPSDYETWEESQGRLETTKLDKLQRSFTVGTGIVAANATGGQALRVQTLDPLLVASSYQQSDAKLMQILMSEGVIGNGAVSQEYTNIEAYGNDLDAFFAEDGDSISTDGDKVAVADSTFQRYVKNVRIMVTRRQVSILSAKAATLVEPMAIENANAALDLIGKANGYLYNGNPLVANTQFEGIWFQHWTWATGIDPASTYIPKTALRVQDWSSLRQRLNPFVDVRNLGYSADLLSQSGQKTTEAMLTSITADAETRFAQPALWLGRTKTVGALIGSTADRMRYVAGQETGAIGRPVVRLISGNGTVLGVVGDALYNGSPVSPIGNNGQAYESATAKDWATEAASGDYTVLKHGTASNFTVYDEDFANGLTIALKRHDPATYVGFSVTAVDAGGGDDSTNINPLVYGTLNNFSSAGTLTLTNGDDPSASANSPFGNLTSTPANYVGKHITAGVGNKEYAVQFVNRKGEVSSLIKLDNADASAAGKAVVVCGKVAFSSTVTSSHLKNVRVRVFSRTEASGLPFRYLADVAILKYTASNNGYFMFLDNGLFSPGTQHNFLLTMSKNGQWNTRLLLLGFFPRQLAPTTRSDNFAYLLMGTPIVRVPSWNTIVTGISNG